jgi:hypothetical protein
MGMFDYIRCDVQLPDGFKGELQTKDLTREMAEHVITAEGRLILRILDRQEFVPKSVRPYPNAPEDSIQHIIGSLRRFWRDEISDFHGILYFYGSHYETPQGDIVRLRKGVLCHQGSIFDAETGKILRRVCHEYHAKFTDGQLVEIKQLANSHGAAEHISGEELNDG